MHEACRHLLSLAVCSLDTLLGNMQGQLAAALVPFDEVFTYISVRTRVGGEATLQKAICLDSLVCTCSPSVWFQTFLLDVYV